MEYKDMLPHQQRVVDEKLELDGKIGKLKDFINSPIFDRIPEEEQVRLHRQFHYMVKYSDILDARADAFGTY